MLHVSVAEFSAVDLHLGCLNEEPASASAMEKRMAQSREAGEWRDIELNRVDGGNAQSDKVRWIGLNELSILCSHR